MFGSAQIIVYFLPPPTIETRVAITFTLTHTTIIYFTFTPHWLAKARVVFELNHST